MLAALRMPNLSLHWSMPLTSTCSKEALRSVVISQRLLGTKEIVIFHHTDCGMLTFTNEHLREKVKSESPGNQTVAATVDSIDFLTFPHLEQSVEDDVKYLKDSQLLVEGSTVTGWVYDVHSGKVRFALYII